PLAVVELAQDEGEVQRAGQTAEVDRDERRHAEHAARQDAELRAHLRGARRADVPGEDGELRRAVVAPGGARTDNRLGRHETGHCTPRPAAILRPGDTDRKSTRLNS